MSTTTPEPSAAKVVAIAASAGGLNALICILSALPRDFAAPILVVQHLDPRHDSHLAELYRRRTDLAVAEAQDGVTPRPGAVYVAPPDRHLLLDADRRLRLTREPREHFTRPAADVLFRSVAETYGPEAVGVVCTGGGTDGGEGLLAIRAAGGITIAQDEATCEHFSMPSSAIRLGGVCRVLPIQGIAPELVRLVGLQ